MTRQRALLLLMVIVLLSSLTGRLASMTGINLGYELNRGIFQWVMLISYSLPILTYPIFSVWSDALGRRPFILIAMVFKLLETIVIATSDSILLLAIAQLIGTATNWAMLGFMVYSADLTTSKNRAEIFAILGAVAAVGTTIGSWLSRHAYEFPDGILSYANPGIMLITITITYLTLPESLKEENRTPFNWKEANIVGTTRMLFTNGRSVSLLVVSYLLAVLAVHAISNVRFLFFLGEDKQNVAGLGMFSTVQGVFAVVVAGIMVFMVQSAGRNKTAIAGLIIAMIGAALYAFVPLPVFRTVMLLPLFAAMTTAIIMSLLSEKVGPGRHGAIIAGAISLGSAVDLLALQNSAFYGYLIQQSAEMPFLTTVIPAAILLLSILPFIAVPKQERT